jgi:hypothetical protein
MLEANGTSSDLFADFFTTGSSVENVFFFSDNESGGGLPATCTPSPVCTILPAITENGAQQTVLTVINPTTQALVSTFTAASDLEVVPESSTILLLGIAFGGLGILRRAKIAE